MLYYLVMCKSLTYAQRTANLLGRSGIRGEILRAPHSLAVDGCGYCVKILGSYIRQAFVILRNNELMPKRVFGMNQSGQYEEVDVM